MSSRRRIHINKKIRREKKRFLRKGVNVKGLM
jgi:hypothetical protein